MIPDIKKTDLSHFLKKFKEVCPNYKSCRFESSFIKLWKIMLRFRVKHFSEFFRG